MSVRRTRIMVAAAFLLGLLRYLPIIDDPWANKVEDQFTLNYAGRNLEIWERFGFIACRGLPMSDVFPSNPPTEFRAYLTHPPLEQWSNHFVTRAFGRHRWSLRLFSAVTSAATLALLTAILLRHASVAAVGLTIAVLMVNRMSVFIGYMANYESPVLALVLLGFHLRQRARMGGAHWPVAVAQFFAIWMDWGGVFLAPLLHVDEVWRPPDERRLRVLISCAFLPLILAIVSVVAFYAAAHGSLAETLQQMRASALSAIEVPTIPSFASWIDVQRYNLVDYFGIGLVCCVALVFALVALRKTSSPIARIAVCLSIPGVLNISCFFRRAYDHEFWWYYGLAGVAGATCCVLDELRRRRLALAFLFAALLIGENAYISWRHLESKLSYDSREFDERINAWLGHDDVLFLPQAVRYETFGISAFVCGSKSADIDIDRIESTWNRDGFRGRRVVVLVPDWLDEKRPDIAKRLRSLVDVRQLGVPNGTAYLLDGRGE